MWTFGWLALILVAPVWFCFGSGPCAGHLLKAKGFTESFIENNIYIYMFLSIYFQKQIGNYIDIYFCKYIYIFAYMYIHI